MSMKQNKRQLYLRESTANVINDIVSAFIVDDNHYAYGNLCSVIAVDSKQLVKNCVKYKQYYCVFAANII